MEIKNVSLTTPVDYKTQQASIDRQRKLAEALQQQAMTPADGQMVSGWYVPPSWSQHVSKLASALLSGKQLGDLDKEESDLAKNQSQQRADTITKYIETLRGKKAMPAQFEEAPPMPTMPLGSGMSGINTVANDIDPNDQLLVGTLDRNQIAPSQSIAPDPRGAVDLLMRSNDPQLQQIGLEQSIKALEPKIVGRTMKDSTGKTIGVDETWQEEQKSTRELKKEEAQAKREADGIARQEKFEQEEKMRRLVMALRPTPQGPAPQMITNEQGVFQIDRNSRATPVIGPDGKPLSGKSAADKPLPNKVITDLKEARDTSTSLTKLQNNFKDDYAGKGIFGIGADLSMEAKGRLGADKDAVGWWKDYKKQAELVERHAMFGASLTTNEQAAWKSADIHPGLDPDVIKNNLAVRDKLARKVLANTAADYSDAGYDSEKINKIAGREQNNIPADAIKMLKANPSLRPQFDQKYGQGAARSHLGE